MDTFFIPWAEGVSEPTGRVRRRPLPARTGRGPRGGRTGAGRPGCRGRLPGGGSHRPWGRPPFVSGVGSTARADLRPGLVAGIPLCCARAAVTPTSAPLGGARGSSGAQGCGSTGEAPEGPGPVPGLRPAFRKPSCPLSPRLISQSVPSGLLFPVRFLCEEGGLGKFAPRLSPQIGFFGDFGTDFGDSEFWDKESSLPPLYQEETFPQEEVVN